MDVIEKIDSPVYGFYGGEDQRANATIATTEKLMKKAGKEYKYGIYKGAGHAYMRSKDDPEGSDENKTAGKKSMERAIKVLKST